MSNIGNQKTINLALKGFSWSVFGNLIRAIAGFATNIFLARLLGPEPFGVVAFALLVISVCNLIIEFGLASALVQQEEIENQDIAFAFTIQLTLSIFFTIIVFLLAPWISLQFGNESATPVIHVMSIILVLQVFAQVPSALLRREMKFKQLQIGQVVSFFVGFVFVGVPLALLGHGVWSLVIATIIQFGLNALIVLIAARHSLAISFKGSRKLTLFGIRTLFANIANWIIQNIDSAIVGRKFGTTNLGYYNRAYQLNWAPTGIFLASAQQSLFSAISRMGKSTGTIKIFRGFMSVFSIFFFSAYCLIALESKNIIQLIYGIEWLPSAALLAPLALAMPFYILVGLEGPVLNGLGKPEMEMRAQWITAIFAVVVLIVASTISLEVAAWSILVIYIFRLVMMSVMTVKALTMTWFELFKPIFIGIVMGIVTLLIWSLINLFVPGNLSSWLIFTIRSVFTLSLCILIFWIGRSWFFVDFPLSEILKALARNSNANTDMDHNA